VVLVKDVFNLFWKIKQRCHDFILSPRKRKAFASIGKITKVIRILAPIYFSEKYYWLMLWTVSCGGLQSSFNIICAASVKFTLLNC